MRVAFRVDASIDIGTGHVMRCLTLAQWLQRQGVTCSFISVENPLNRLVTDRGFELHRIDNTAILLNEKLDADLFLKRIPIDTDWIIVDHYRLGKPWEQRVRHACRFLAAIDDLADRAHDVDLLIDQNQLPDALQRYDGLLQPHTKQLLGSRYAMLRPDFEGNARKDREGHLQRLLVSFGGTDPSNETDKVMQALSELGWSDRHIDVVVGSAYPYVSELTDRHLKHPKWKLHINTPHMAELMHKADLAISACGISTWERCASALPSIVLTTAENQRPLARAVAAEGAALWLGEASATTSLDVANALRVLDRAPHTLQAMSRQAGLLCDGTGVQRVGNAIISKALTLRDARAEDEAPILQWRNHPSVRTFSGNGQTITCDTHHQWFCGVLNDPTRTLLIAEIMEKPIAVVRFDQIDEEAQEISIYLCPEIIGAGWGQPVLELSMQWLTERLDAKSLRAHIHPDNIASQRIFRRAGFLPSTQVWRYEIQHESN